MYAVKGFKRIEDLIKGTSQVITETETEDAAVQFWSDNRHKFVFIYVLNPFDTVLIY